MDKGQSGRTRNSNSQYTSDNTYLTTHSCGKIVITKLKTLYKLFFIQDYRVEME